VHPGSLQKMQKHMLTLKKCIFIAAGAALAVLFRRTIFSLFGLLTTSGVLVFLLEPLCSLFEKRFPRGISAVLSVASAALIVLGALFLILPSLISQIMQLGAVMAEISGAIQKISAQLEEKIGSLGIDASQIWSMLEQMDFSNIMNKIASGILGAGNSVYRLGLAAVLCCFFLADRENISLRLELWIPSEHRALAVRMAKACLREMRTYVRGQAMVSVAVGLLCVAALFIAGVPSFLPLGLLAGIFNLIPYFGPILGAVPAVLAGATVSLRCALFCAIGMFAVQQIDGLLISPRIMGNITGISPAIVLLSIYAGAQLGGIIGMLFALPFIMSIRTLYRVFAQHAEKN